MTPVRQAPCPTAPAAAYNPEVNLQPKDDDSFDSGQKRPVSECDKPLKGQGVPAGQFKQAVDAD